MSETDVGLSELPDGWMWTTLEQIGEVILGQSPPSSTYNTQEEGLPFYQGKLEFGETYPTPIWCFVFQSKCKIAGYVSLGGVQELNEMVRKTFDQLLKGEYGKTMARPSRRVL